MGSCLTKPATATLFWTRKLKGAKAPAIPFKIKITVLDNSTYLSLFLSLSLSLSLFPSLSLSLSSFLSLCISFSLSLPRYFSLFTSLPLSLSLSLFLSLSLAISLSLPPCLFLSLSLVISLSLPPCLFLSLWPVKRVWEEWVPLQARPHSKRSSFSQSVSMRDHYINYIDILSTARRLRQFFLIWLFLEKIYKGGFCWLYRLQSYWET